MSVVRPALNRTCSCGTHSCPSFSGYRTVVVNLSGQVGFFNHYFQCCCVFWHLMNCYDRRLRKTGPERENSRNDLVAPPARSRVNGWTLPLHSFQLIAWVLYVYLATVGFGIYIPLLPYNWKYVGYAIIGLIFVFHFVVHLVAVSIDPADNSVRAKKNYNTPMPMFDRTKHPHVIQNLHCYLCEVDVFFFYTVVSAVLGILLLVLVVLYVFIQQFVNPAQLRTAPQFKNLQGNNTWLAFLPVAPIETSKVGILVIAGVTFLLGIASLLLLGHLLGFHVYLLFKKLSTYEYIVRERHSQNVRDHGNDPESARTAAARMTSAQDKPTAKTQLDSELTTTASRSSASKYQDQEQFTNRTSNGICQETFSVSTSAIPSHSQQEPNKRPRNGLQEDSNIDETKFVSEKTSTAQSNPEPQDKSDGTLQIDHKHLKEPHRESLESIEEIPVVQNPLGSATMESTCTEETSNTHKSLGASNESVLLDNTSSLLANPRSSEQLAPKPMVQKGTRIHLNKQK
eukprot:gi/632945040/ref/XP_007887836.1/ PREDICTED: probable palmitoyltransferase ZDHHC11B isoform X2 [Callorhinchus milii]